MAIRKRHEDRAGEESINLNSADHPQEFMGRDNLADFLTISTGSDGKPRETGAVTIFYRNGRISVSLNDKDAEEIAYLTIGRGSSILDEIDEALMSADTEWQKWKAGKKKS
jgi:hypothetical protein